MATYAHHVAAAIERAEVDIDQVSEAIADASVDDTSPGAPPIEFSLAVLLAETGIAVTACTLHLRLRDKIQAGGLADQVATLVKRLGEDADDEDPATFAADAVLVLTTAWMFLKSHDPTHRYAMLRARIVKMRRLLTTRGG